MLRIMGVLLLVFSSLSSICQSTSKYQVGTITQVSVHEPAHDAAVPTSYDVSVQVDRIIYVVQYTPQFGLNTVRYSAGRQLMVSVGKDTITYNDILGQPFEVPILSRRPVETVSTAPKPAEASVGTRKTLKSDKQPK